jgi:hypothetical protein
MHAYSKVSRSLFPSKSVPPEPIPAGLCQCGCGKPTPVATENHKQNGWIKGQPHRFIYGHNGKGKSNPRWKDLTGRKFGRLTVLSFVTFDAAHHSLWLCECSCGTCKVIAKASLVRGLTKSCGCLHRETSIANGKANATHGLWRSRAYRSWVAMRNRCNNPINRSRTYVGVQICNRWQRVENFLTDLGERPEGTTLGRYLDIDNYQPGNACWMTSAEQLAEKRGRTAMLRFQNAFGHQGVSLLPHRATKLLKMPRKQKVEVA